MEMNVPPEVANSRSIVTTSKAQSTSPKKLFNETSRSKFFKAARATRKKKLSSTRNTVNLRANYNVTGILYKRVLRAIFITNEQTSTPATR